MPESLLAVDLGLKTGLACYGRDGRLQWYRSSNVGSRTRLKKAAESILREAGDVQFVIMEGGGDLTIPWITECRRIGVKLLQVDAHRWRNDLLLPREQRSGVDAKKHADTIARQIISWSEAKRPTSLRHDAAEAICIGFWGVLRAEWISRQEVGGMWR